MELLLLSVLMLGVGLGTAAAAWATRRPETVIEFGSSALTYRTGHPTPEDVAQFREFWEMAFPPSATAPNTPPPDPEPKRPNPTVTSH